MTYTELLDTKRFIAPSVGVEVDPDEFNPQMFGFQRDLTKWALRKGRAALFATTGMGKTLMQLEWAKHAAERTLIVAPLGVARQTVAEAAKWGMFAAYARTEADARMVGITVTNYEMVDHFSPEDFGAVVLDESSILKSFEGKTRTKLIEMFADVPMRLCCTATPAPNDIAEIANHAEFLGLMTRTEMLAMFFVHDDDGWRLKGHAHEAFYRWMASWAASLTKPSDLGYPDDGYDLPPLVVKPVIVRTDYVQEGQLFNTGIKGITDRSRIRKDTVDARTTAAVKLVAENGTDSPWVVWCGLNDEQDGFTEAMGPWGISIYGSLTPDEKLARLTAWMAGEAPVLATKTSIFGFGLNMQHCHRMIFLGLNDSWESYFQAIRRCWRFGQTEPVEVYVVISDVEEPIFQNVLRKDREAQAMTAELVARVRDFELEEIRGMDHVAYAPTLEMVVPTWL